MRKLLTIIALITICSCKNSKNQVITERENLRIEPIAFVSDRDGNSEIYMMDSDGKNLQRLTNSDSLDFSPSWSKVDNKLYFYSKREGNSEIYSIDIENKKLNRLTNNPANDILPVPSPKGNLILFISDRNSSRKNLYSMDKNGSKIKSLTNNRFYEESPDWSPDGKKIIFTRQLRDSKDTSHAGNGEIHLMDSNGSNLIRLTNKDGYDSGAKFSPDGKKIAFYGYNQNQWDLYIMNSDGSDLNNLTDDIIECYSPDWSSNGEWLVYTAGKDGNYNIWKINIKTKERLQLTNTTGRNEGPVWR